MDISLRDYFAAKAMQSIIIIKNDDSQWEHDNTAETAYNVADAMLAERAEDAK